MGGDEEKGKRWECLDQAGRFGARHGGWGQVLASRWTMEARRGKSGSWLTLTAGSRVLDVRLLLCAAGVAAKLADGGVGGSVCAAHGRCGGRGRRTGSDAGAVSQTILVGDTDASPSNARLLLTRLCNTQPALPHTACTLHHTGCVSSPVCPSLLRVLV